MTNHTPFKAQRVTRSAALTLPAPPERAFPLFGPIREAEWAEGWQPDLVYAASPLGDEPGAVFTTHHLNEPDTIWLVAQFDPKTCTIEYVRVTPGLRIARVTIICRPAPGGATHADVTYQFTALSEEGNHSVEEFSEAHYQHMMSAWQTAISHTLATGTRLHHHP